MSDELKDHTSLLVIKSGRLTLMADLLEWVGEWCKGLYEDVAIRNTSDGSFEILGKLKDQITK